MKLVPFESLDDNQKDAIEAITAWWKAKASDQFVLTGYAGTGKTTIIRHVAKRIPCIMGAPTGKAASNLRNKTGSDASTLHKLAYDFMGEDEKGRPQFIFKGLIDGTYCLVIDESSMLDRQIYEDLMGKGYRILFVGDPGQLPPVGESPGILDNPDFVLTENHRQKGNAPLLDFAHGIRSGNYLPEIDGEILRKWPRWDDAGVAEILTESSVVLCYKNATRHRLNLQMLKLRGLVSPETQGIEEVWPQLVGKVIRIIGLRNYPDLDLWNGSEKEFLVQRIGEFGIFGELRHNAIDFEEVTLSKANFLVDKAPDEERRRRDRLLADFGYCLTTHKSQGSEWPHVVVYDDTNQGMQHHSRWCYTAATRAESRLTWIHNGPGLGGPKKNIDPA